MQDRYLAAGARRAAGKPRTSGIRFAILIGASLLVSACGSKPSKPREMAEIDALPVAKMLIEPRLREPESAEYSGIIFHPKTAELGPIICGYVNSRNGFGGMTGPKRFVAGGTLALEEELGSANMDVVWNRFC